MINRLLLGDRPNNAQKWFSKTLNSSSLLSLVCRLVFLSLEPSLMAWFFMNSVESIILPIRRWQNKQVVVSNSRYVFLGNHWVRSAALYHAAPPHCYLLPPPPYEAGKFQNVGMMIFVTSMPGCCPVAATT